MLLVPETNVPFLFGENPNDITSIKEKIEVANRTVRVIEESGGYLPPATMAEEAEAKELFTQIQQGGHPNIPLRRLATPMGQKLWMLLKTYDEDVVENAMQMRNYVVNRLIEESEASKSPQTRLKALELLGKMGDVGLFVERTENVNITKNLSDDELNKKLKELLEEKVVEVNEVKSDTGHSGP